MTPPRAPRRLVLGIAVFLALPALVAWDATGHRTVAEIAWEHMTPRARARAVALLLHGPPLAGLASLRPGTGTAAERDRALFVNAATWPDLVRERGTPWHVYNRPSWHYADFFWDEVDGRARAIPGTGPDSVNAGERIELFRAQLADTSLPDTARAVALAWLLHLVGDVHQPLHASSRVTADDPLPRGDEGGNTFHLDDGHRLHGFWDDILDEALPPDGAEDPIAYAARLARTVEAADPLDSLGAAARSTDVRGWEDASLHLAETVAYAGVTRGAAPAAAYERRALAVSERQIALAGYRLAGLLDAILN